MCIVTLPRPRLSAGTLGAAGARENRPLPLGAGRATVAIRGTKYPQVGRIAMDQFLVDVGDDPVAVGDRVVLWGDPATGAPSASDWARAADTIGYEIVTRVGSRVPRVFVDGTVVDGPPAP